MSGGCATRVARLVDRAFVRELSSGQRRRLRAHLAMCEPCRVRWDRLAIIDRRLGGPTLSAAILEDIGDRVVEPARQGARRRVVWAAAGGLLTAAAITLVVVARAGGPRETFTPRGTSDGAGRTPGVRVFCVAGDRDHVRAEARMVSSAQVPQLRCTIADDVQLTYTTPQREGLTMVAFARRDGAIFHYAPAAATDAALELAADQVDQLVGWSTPLFDHPPGGYDMIVRVFDRAVSAAEATGDRSMPLVELRTRLEVLPRGGLVDAP